MDDFKWPMSKQFSVLLLINKKSACRLTKFCVFFFVRRFVLVFFSSFISFVSKSTSKSLTFGQFCFVCFCYFGFFILLDFIAVPFVSHFKVVAFIRSFYSIPLTSVWFCVSRGEKIILWYLIDLKIYTFPVEWSLIGGRSLILVKIKWEEPRSEEIQWMNAAEKTFFCSFLFLFFYKTLHKLHCCCYSNCCSLRFCHKLHNWYLCCLALKTISSLH